VFVNKIVKIVHDCAKKWDGVPTNNNGDRYILSWKLPTQNDVKKPPQPDSARNDGQNEETQ